MRDAQPRELGRVVVPVSGTDADAAVIEAAAQVAGRFGAELGVAYAPPDPAELTPWLGEGFVGGVQVAALESLKAAASEGEVAASTAYAGCAYEPKTLTVLSSPVWRGLALECRLADLVVFDGDTARGKSPLSELFEQVLMEERAATLVIRGGDTFGAAVVAWDGGEPASRAARRAVPLLRRCERVTIIGAPVPDRPCELERLQAYYAARGLQAGVRALDAGADVSAALTEAAEAEGAGLLVAGAFGRSRLREFIFGGTTRTLLNAAGPSLFTAH